MQEVQHRVGVEISARAGLSHLNLVKHTGHVSAVQRQQFLSQRPWTVWLTGLSGAGKSTLAYEMERQLLDQSRVSYVLDGDNLRHHLNSDLGFRPQDRSENIRRVAEVAALMNDAGIIVITALISPRCEDRAIAREIVGASRFIEVHVNTSLSVCEGRDPKGLYAKARAGLIPEFTGISAPYEAPLAPDYVVDTGVHGIEAGAAYMLSQLQARWLLPA